MKADRLSRAREFSHWVKPDELPAAGLTLELEATASEREALAERFDLVGLHSLTAQFRVRALAAGPVVRVEGRIEAQVVQRCVVTLEDVPATVAEEIAAEFGPEEGARNVELSLEDADPIEPFEAEGIDLGELAAQHLALALDPYPHAAEAPGRGAVYRLGEAAEQDGDRQRPFAVLGRLKAKDGNAQGGDGGG